jgi:hypothetical protein
MVIDVLPPPAPSSLPPARNVPVPEVDFIDASKVGIKRSDMKHAGLERAGHQAGIKRTEIVVRHEPSSKILKAPAESHLITIEGAEEVSKEGVANFIEFAASRLPVREESRLAREQRVRYASSSHGTLPRTHELQPQQLGVYDRHIRVHEA